ncbi:hypothetical protein B0J11DRAFT_524524 [Dendryphion nanum]|uniref:Uncharacterized protein n=1 Tax=Dendryphion nanum TaxID=256645 RepID=A0A9P9DXI2_9PLEO|nr:hypothetical protein B0J11DRAFT_524524 [Dendryphion nanum]
MRTASLEVSLVFDTIYYLVTFYAMNLSLWFRKCQIQKSPGKRCKSRRETGSQFCTKHSCTIRSCEMAAQLATTLCKNHTCTFFRCKLAVTSPDEHLCPTHRCDVCSNPRRTDLDSAYCDEHACAVRTCPARRANQVTAYCQVHKCQVTDCNAEAHGQRYCFANGHWILHNRAAELKGEEEDHERVIELRG